MNMAQTRQADKKLEMLMQSSTKKLQQYVPSPHPKLLRDTLRQL